MAIVTQPRQQRKGRFDIEGLLKTESTPKNRRAGEHLDVSGSPRRREAVAEYISAATLQQRVQFPSSNSGKSTGRWVDSQSVRAYTCSVKDTCFVSAGTAVASPLAGMMIPPLQMAFVPAAPLQWYALPPVACLPCMHPAMSPSAWPTAGRSLASAAARASSYRRRKPRTVFTSEQLIVLESQFGGSKYLSVAERYFLAQRLGLSEQQVKTWFQNRRTKSRKTAEDEATSSCTAMPPSSEHAATARLHCMESKSSEQLFPLV